ncbi:hypothetical protein TrCOL_g2054 [Triparma columacea]|uniref:Uncharacterized protein n=1 Tax=Triparma columacea TaxID=722753 RepID=A0A9W7GPC3_9STRA|nr:hypothetical protein TrCOL_g2054 [Triparma columacea]
MKPTYVKAIVSSIAVSVEEVGTTWEKVFIVPSYYNGSGISGKLSGCTVEMSGGGELREIGVGPLDPCDIGKDERRKEEMAREKGGKKKKKGKKNAGAGFDAAIKEMGDLNDLYAGL